MHYALIDESGRLHDPNDKILTFAVLTTHRLVGLDKIISKARKRIPKKGKRRQERLSEIKFSLSGDKTRKFVLSEIAKQNIKICTFTVDKKRRSIADTPKNYALLITGALEKPLQKNARLEHILIDKHFSFITQREEFNNFLQKNFKRKLFVEHLDGLQNPVISLADFVAGAVRFKHIHKEDKFSCLVKSLIVEERIVTWKKLKQKAVKL